MLNAREFPPDHFPRTLAALKEGVAAGVAPGMVAGLWSITEPEQMLAHAEGVRRVVPTSQSLGVDTVFDLASLTKVMGTATLAALLVERRWISWDTSITSLLPEFPFPDIRLSHLLSHTAGLTAWKPFWQMLRDRFGQDPAVLARIPISERQRAMREFVVEVAPEAAPGERMVYSDLSFLLLGFALEKALQMDLDRAVTDLVWKPMGVSGASYRRVDRDTRRGNDESVAATELCPWRGGVLQGQVHDDNAWAMGGYAGHAGAFGSARDVLGFARGLAQGFLSFETIHQAWRRVALPVGCTRTLGWDTPSGPDSLVGSRFSGRSVGHWGFTGTGLWIDRDAGIAVTLLTNRVHPSRENPAIREFRPRFHNALRADLGF